MLFPRGPVFSIILPFNFQEKVDYISLKKYLYFLYKRGARAFYIMPYNGRYALLDYNETLNVNLFCIKELKKLSQDNYVIGSDPIHCSTKVSIDICKILKKNGADACSLIFGEKYYSDDQVFKHFKKISSKTNIKLFLHQQEFEKGIFNNKNNLYNLQLLKRILNLKNFVGMKEDAKNDKYTNKIVKLFGLKKIILTSGQGKIQWIKFHSYCYGWISGVSNLDPYYGIKFYQEYKKGNLKFCKQIIKDFEIPFFKLSNKLGWHLTIKAFLKIINIMDNHERSPLIKLDQEKYKKVKQLSLTFKKINKKKYNNIFFSKKSIEL